MTEPLVDAHAHFYHAESGRADWERINAARMRAGEAMGVTYHVVSVLGSYGHTSPTYFPSPPDVSRGNDVMRAMADADRDRVRWYVTVNPNHTAHALDEIARGVAAGAVGVKLLASRRADDALNDPICELAAEHGLPILHHIWQHRTREWPNQEISDGCDLARLAARHPRVAFILAHLGGGGDWAHTLPAVVDTPNVYPDLSGSGVDRGMIDARSARARREAPALGVRSHDGDRARQAPRARGHRAVRGRPARRALGERRAALSVGDLSALR